jgi:hypothetical protein
MFGIESFDVVIGNPPYLKERGNKEKFLTVHASPLGKKYKKGKMDFWYYFLHRGIDLLSSNGAIAFITPSYWTQGEGSARLIEHIHSSLIFRAVINIGDLKVFEAVAGHHMVAIYQKATNPDQVFVYRKLVDSLEDLNSPTDTPHVAVKEVSNGDVFQTGQIIFEGDASELSSGHKLGTYYKVSQGVVEATDRVASKKRPPGMKIAGVFVLTSDEIDQLGLTQNEKLALKRYISSKDVDRYSIAPREEYLIYSDKEVREKISNGELAVIKKHLDNQASFITSSNAPYGLHRPRTKDFFEEKKIVFKGMFKSPEFAIDENGSYFGMSMLSVLPIGDDYSLELLLGILNSQFAESWFNRNGKKRGVGVDIGVAKLREFPLPDLSLSETKKIAEHVETFVRDAIQTKTEGKDSEKLEKEIDELVIRLYQTV